MESVTRVIYDLVVIGGGPAGTAAAIAGARAGRRVLLLERGQLPRQKVCGEFVSAEGLETLRDLDAATEEMLLRDAPRIGHARLFVDGSEVELPVEPPAASITRYHLDFALWRAAEAVGAECRQQTDVQSIKGKGPFCVAALAAEGGRAMQEHTAHKVIDASGRWSRLRMGAGEAPAAQPAGRQRYVGLKAHFRTAEGGRPTVDLYFFRGGYCGVQPIGQGQVNVCAMVKAELAATLDEVLGLHPTLRKASREWQPLGEAVATSPLIFEKPQPVRAGVLCAGDAAGFVDPFVGDGITLALRSGRVAATCTAEEYEEEYRRTLAPVFENASWLRRVMELPRMLRAPILAALRTPGVGRAVVKGTRAR